MAQTLYPNELQSGTLVLEFLEYAPHPFLRVPTYFFEMVQPATSERMGLINLRDAHGELIEQYAGHIGYKVSEVYRGQRLALQAVEMLKPLASRLGLNPLWITCDPENAASRRTCELSGGELIETVDVPPESRLYRGGARRKCRFRVML